MSHISNKDPKKPVLTEKKSPLVEHAERELKLAGIDKSDSDYGGMLYRAVLELVRTFSKQQHSGTSAELTVNILTQLLNFEVLTPVTDDPAEWKSVSEIVKEPMWQNVRGGNYFSRDGGKSWFHINTNQKGRSISKSEEKNETEKAPQEKPKTDKK